MQAPRFEPWGWGILAGGHAQSVAGALLPPRRRPSATRVELPVAAGMLVGQLSRCPGADTIALLVHGITGSAEEPCVVRTARKLVARGIDALRLDLRGAGESRACRPALHHSGLTDDLERAVIWLGRRYPRIVLIGFSLGGQLVLRKAGEWGGAPPSAVRAAVAVSPPIDLARTSTYLERPAGAPYRWVVLARLRARYHAARATLAPEHRGRRLRARTLHEYNATVSVPVFGYRSLEDHYARTSSGRLLDRVSVPTLVIHAEDDPVVPVGPVREAVAQASPAVRFLITARGGHVGFLAGATAPGEPDRHWAENRAIDFVAQPPAPATRETSP